MENSLAVLMSLSFLLSEASCQEATRPTAKFPNALQPSSTFTVDSQSSRTETVQLTAETVYKHSVIEASSPKAGEISGKYNETIIYVTHTNATLFRPDVWPVVQTDLETNKALDAAVISQTGQSDLPSVQTSQWLDGTHKDETESVIIDQSQSASQDDSQSELRSLAYSTLAVLASGSSETKSNIPQITGSVPSTPQTASKDSLESSINLSTSSILFQTSSTLADRSASFDSQPFADFQSTDSQSVTESEYLVLSSEVVNSETLRTPVTMTTPETTSDTFVIDPGISQMVSPSYSSIVSSTDNITVALSSPSPEATFVFNSELLMSTTLSASNDITQSSPSSVVSIATTELASTPVIQTVAMATTSTVDMTTLSVNTLLSETVSPTSVVSVSSTLSVPITEPTFFPDTDTDATTSLSLTDVPDLVSTEDSTFSLDLTETMETSTDSPVAMTTYMLLNTSDAYNNFWVRTVIEEDVTDPDVIQSAEYWLEMEARLAEVYNEALIKEAEDKNAERTKRAIQVEQATVQMTNVTRPNAGEDKVDLIYFLVEGDDPLGNLTEAARAVDLLNLYFTKQRMTLIMGRPVLIMAEIYLPPEEEEDKKLWIIGAVLGGLVGLVLLVWGCLFIYFKCTRPSKAYHQGKSPPSPLPPDTEPELVDYKKKDSKGFDYVRTEVGMENELVKEQQMQQQKSAPESYRKRPYGSSELEGMYSPAESTPSKYPQNKSSAPVTASAPPPGQHRQGSGRGYPPPGRGRGVPYASRGRGQPRGHPPQQRSQRPGEGDSSSYESEISEQAMKKDSAQLLHSSGRGQRSQSREVTPHSSTEVHRTVHPIQLTGLPQQQPAGVTEEALETARKQQQEMEDTLRQKAEIERYRNKKRQRDKKRGKKHGSPSRDKDETVDDSAGLAELSVAKQKKKKKKSKKKGQKMSRVGVYTEGDSPDSLEMRAMAAQGIDPLYRGNDPPQPLLTSDRNKQLAQMESDSSATEEDGEDDTLREARQHMHNLLDDAFTLLTPQQHRKSNKVTPISSYSYANPSAVLYRGHRKVKASKRVNFDPSISVDHTPDLSGTHSPDESLGVEPARRSQDNHTPVQLSPGPHHTPLYVQPPAKKNGDSLLWNPYEAADEAAKIPDNGPHPVTSRPHQRSPYLNQLPASSPHQYSNPSYTSDPSDPSGSRSMGYSTEQPEPLYKTAAEVKKTWQPDDYTSIVMDSSMLTPQAQRSQRSLNSADTDSSTKHFKPTTTNSIVNGAPSTVIPNQSEQLFHPAGSRPNQSGHLSQTDGYRANGIAGGKPSYKDRGLLGPDSDIDEIDIAARTGASAEPLVTSIREELERLAQQANGVPPGRGVNITA